MTTYYLDPRSAGGGNDSNTGLSFAQRKLTLGSISPSPGDTIRVIESSAPTPLGVDALWTNLDDELILDSQVNETITNCETNWTSASGDVICTRSTNSGSFKQGSASQNIVIQTAFTTGKVAYFATGTLDLSNFEQISFWINTTSPKSANTFRICLCSDTTGDTPVDNLDIDFDLPSFRWIPVTINKGSALGSSIQSIALYCLSDPGFSDILLDNIFAVTSSTSDDCLDLNSLIGKNTGDEQWWTVRSVSGTTVALDISPGSTAARRGYYGTTETVPTYIRKTLKVPFTNSESQQMTSSGSSGSLIEISGGWNSTDMSTQTGVSWLDGSTGNGTGWNLTGSYLNVDKVGSVRFNNGFIFTGNYFSGDIYGSNSNTTYGVRMSSGIPNGLIIRGATSNDYGVYVDDLTTAFALGNLININSNLTKGILLGNSRLCWLSDVSANNNSSIGLHVTQGGVWGGNITCSSNSSNGVQLSNTLESMFTSIASSSNGASGLALQGASSTTYSLQTAGNTTSGCAVSGSLEVNHYLYNATISDSTRVTVNSNLNQKVYSQNELGVLNNNHIYFGSGTISIDTSDPNTPGGLDWQLSPTSTSRNSLNPLRLSLAKIALNAGSYTFGAFCKKTHLTNVDGRLIIYAGSAPGIGSDVVGDINSTSYSSVSLPFTVSQNCVVEVFVEAWSEGSTTDSVRVADISIG